MIGEAIPNVCAEMNKRSFMRARINISACLFHIFSDYKNVYIFLFIITGHFLRWRGKFCWQSFNEINISVLSD